MDEGHGKKGWLLLRSSLHDPLLVLNVESDLPGGRCSAEGVTTLAAQLSRCCAEAQMS